MNGREIVRLRSLMGAGSGGSGGSGGGGDEGSQLDALIDRSITEITSNVGKISDYVFYQYYNLTTADFPAATSIGAFAFYQCSNLTTADFPAATSIGDYAFYGCSKLTATDFPVATSIGNEAFRKCSKLTATDFPVATSIGTYAFRECFKLTAVILRIASVATLKSTNAFADCYHFHGTTHSTYNPNGLKDGYIYVPAALVEDYKAATNWSTFASQFRALEDYTVDGTTTGALDPNKI